MQDRVPLDRGGRGKEVARSGHAGCGVILEACSWWLRCRSRTGDTSFAKDAIIQAVNGLQARTFGIWTLLSSVIRCYCAIDIRNKTLYNITLLTFFIALGHFLSEVFIYGTAAATIGVLAPLMVASFSILGMLIGLQYLEVEATSQNKKRN
ncbi:ergosterol biosynthetic protein 28 homolog isoform X2 [Paroedura picta]|uniref:ergosterol biosynthetic protein 28 homolog isoform X2 n=1 Tax=Paroedura picta TaxID=143630 RepID=UPI004056AA0F